MTKEIPSFYLESDEKKLSEIKNPEIRELKQPIEKILEELQENIKEGKYNYIIGDDTSGRIPTLIFDKVLKTVAEKEGKKIPQTIFFAGESEKFLDGDEKRQLQKKKLRQYLELQIKDKKGNKNVLIVTDTILSGDHLVSLSRILKEKDIYFDFATVGLESAFFEGRANQQKEKLEKRLGGKIFYGTLGTPPIYNAIHQGLDDKHKRLPLSGVRKETGSIITEPFKKEMFPQDQVKMQKVIMQTREDAKILSEYLIAWFEKKFSDDSVQK